jgi:hypothetical protein
VGRFPGTALGALGSQRVGNVLLGQLESVTALETSSSDHYSLPLGLPEVISAREAM